MKKKRGEIITIQIDERVEKDILLYCTEAHICPMEIEPEGGYSAWDTSKLEVSPVTLETRELALQKARENDSFCIILRLGDREVLIEKP